MKSLPHEYEVGLQGASAGYATLSAHGLPKLTAAPPPQYDGPGDAWSPEHLLLASVSACFLFTFRALAKASKLDLFDVDIRTTGTVARESGVTRFTEIVVHANVTAQAAADVDRLHRAIEQTERHCLVSSSLTTPVRVQVTVHEPCEACA
jgi:organic hydroperoxide reductase OsmC/OhrA